MTTKSRLMDDSKYYRDSQTEVKFDAEYESELGSLLQTQGAKLETNGQFEKHSKTSSFASILE